MGSRWAMLGNALGGGISQGLQPFIQQKQAQYMAPFQAKQDAQNLQNKVNSVRGLDLNGLNASQLALLGISPKSQAGGDPLSQAVAALVLSQMGGGMGGGTGGGANPPSQQMVNVTDISTGEKGTIPLDEWNSYTSEQRAKYR